MNPLSRLLFELDMLCKFQKNVHMRMSQANKTIFRLRCMETKHIIILFIDLFRLN